ncbi:MAG: nitronate monooxygenase [Deltaproteobacteria bacterium]|nr:nitronate monooxygenase [Deltaproteobacteria bacterium]
MEDNQHLSENEALVTPICKRLGIQHPIFGFSMEIDVVAAVTNAGGFGVYGATRDKPEEIAAKLARLRSLVGDRPFGVDLLLPLGMGDKNDLEAAKAQLPEEHKEFVKNIKYKYHVPDATTRSFFSQMVRSNELFAAQIDAVLKSDANLFASAIGTPQDVIERAKAAGMVTLSLVGAPKHVKYAKAAGIDLIVAQGYDAGGHTGPIGTLSLVPQIVDAAGDIPVLAAGGIGTGRQVVASLALGAQGVWLGTAWLATAEHNLHQILLNKLLKAGSMDTIISRAHSGKSCRVLKTAWSDEWDANGAPKPLKMPFQQVLIGEILTGIMEHEIEPLMYEGAGQGVVWSTEKTTVQQVIEGLLAEAREALARLKII